MRTRHASAADFYTNFAGAKILVARDESNNILGRAVVWNEVILWKSINTPIAASLLDRIYSSHAFVAELIRKQAQEAGILLRRRYNDYTHTTDFTVLNPIEGQEWAVGDNSTGFIDGESACLQVAQERGALPATRSTVFI